LQNNRQWLIETLLSVSPVRQQHKKGCEPLAFLLTITSLAALVISAAE